MLATHVRSVLPFGRFVPKVAPAVDYLLGRAPADAQLQPPACDKIRCAGVFHHIAGVLVTHVDHPSANLDAFRLRAHCSKQRKGRSQLPSKMVDPKVRPVQPEFLGGHGKVYGLQKRVGCRARLRLGRRRPVAEGEESEFFHRRATCHLLFYANSRMVSLSHAAWPSYRCPALASRLE